MSQQTRRAFLMSLGSLGAGALASCAKVPAIPDKTAWEELDDGSGGAPASPISLSVCLFSEPEDLDPALARDMADKTLVAHLFSGLARWEMDDEGSLSVVPDVATELPEPVVNEDGTWTYTYVLQEGRTWSDGTPLTARDFAFAWERLAGLGTDESRLLDVVARLEPEGDAPEGAASEDDEADGSTGEADETASEEGQADDEAADEATPAQDDDVPAEVADVPRLAIEAKADDVLEVTLSHRVRFWNELLASPWLAPVREDVVGNARWARDPSTLVTNGPYSMAGWEQGSVITIERRAQGAEDVPPAVGDIEFFLSDDVANRVSNFDNGTWQVVDVTAYEGLPLLDEEMPGELRRSPRMATYCILWDANGELLPSSSQLDAGEAELARAEVRRALALLFDRSFLAGELLHAGQVPAASVVPWGIADQEGGDFCDHAGHSEGHAGYLDVSGEALEGNYETAMEVLSRHYDYDEEAGRFKDIPPVTLLSEPGLLPDEAVGYLRDALSQVGVDVRVETGQELPIPVAGAVPVVTAACVEVSAPYADPLCVLEAWESGSSRNVAGVGTGDHALAAVYDLDLTDLDVDLVVEGGTWSETYDRLMGVVRSEPEGRRRFALMHRAEDLLMSTGVACPLLYACEARLAEAGLGGWFVTPQGSCHLLGARLMA